MVTSTYRHAELTVTTAGGSRQVQQVQQLKRLSRTELNLQELTDICWQDIHHCKGAERTLISRHLLLLQ